MHRDEKKGSDNRRYYTRTSGHTRTSSPRGNAFVPCSTLARFLSSPPPPPRSIISLTVPCIKHVIVSFDPSLPFLLSRSPHSLPSSLRLFYICTHCVYRLVFQSMLSDEEKKKKNEEKETRQREKTRVVVRG